MTQISRRLEQIVRKELSKNIIPVKTPEGILVGDILITNQLNLKFLHRNQQLLYSEIHLNSIAIKIANILALRRNSITAETLWRADQEYGKWFVDSQMLRAQHQKAIHNQDYDRADMLWARYSESRDRTISAKKQTERLLQFE
jgi:hypothetical protein